MKPRLVAVGKPVHSRHGVTAYRYLILCVFHVVLLAARPASATEWVTIASDQESSFYFDADSLKRDGDLVEVLLLWDFPELQLTRRPVKPYLSATRLTRFDCKAGRRANVESTLYRGRMASGEITEVYRTPDAAIEFEWVNPDAPGGESMRRVCAASMQ